MKENRIGDLLVSEVCLGTMTWGEQNTEAEAHQQLDFALEEGVNFIDTAEMYPVPARRETQGQSERFLGSWFQHSGKRDHVILATKLIGPSRLNWIREGGSLDKTHIKTAVENSLTRLKTDHIDLYQIHWPSRYVPKFGDLHFNPNHFKKGTTPILETIEALSSLIQEGKIRHYGISNETPWGVGKFCQEAQEHNLPKPVSIQNAYNLVNRTFDMHLAETCFHEGIHLLAYSPLAFGYLTGKYRNGAMPEMARVAQFPGFASRYFKKTNLDEAVEAYWHLSKGRLTQLALQFTKSNPLCASTIIGATNLSQLQENLAAFKNPMKEFIIKDINRIHRQFPNPCP